MFATAITAARRKAVPAAALLAVGLTALGLTTSPVGATSAPPTDESTVVLLEAGDLSQPVDIGSLPAVGAAARNTAISGVTGTMTLVGPESGTFEIDVTTTVVKSGEIMAADESGVTMRQTVESYDVTDNSDGGVGGSFVGDEELADLVDIALDYRASADGRLESVVPAPGVVLTPEEEAAVEVIIADELDDVQRYPTEPVGVGAHWTAESPGGPAGQMLATYSLTSLVDGRYTIDVVVEADGHPWDSGNMPRGFDDVTGSLTASGQLVGSVDEPLVRTADMSMDFDLVFTGSAGEMTMDLTMTEQESAVAA